MPVAEEFYGEFFQGDSYLILNSYKKSDGCVATPPSVVEHTRSPWPGQPPPRSTPPSPCEHSCPSQVPGSQHSLLAGH